MHMAERADAAPHGGRGASYGAWLLAAAALASLIVAAVNAFHKGNGIAFSGGAILVLVSTALLFIASLVVLFSPYRPKWLLGILAVLMLLDLLGTGFAAYFLDAFLLVALMVVGFVGWLVNLAAPGGRKAPARAAHEKALSA
jgi:hypothetical protein